MADPRPIKHYACSQAELYAICDIGWQSYEENLTDFTGFSGKYSAQYGTDAKAAVQSARQMPDFQTRNEPAETAHIAMVTALLLCNRNWRKLRRHIHNAFPKDQVKPKVEAAGEGHYKKALARDWAEAELMITSADSFMTSFATQLGTGGMPAAFQATFQTDADAFLILYHAFTDAEQDEVEGTDAKIIANNNIYDTLMSMFEDGQVINEEQEKAAKRNRFIFQQVLDLITRAGGPQPIPTDTATFKGKVTDVATGAPIADVLIEAVLEGTTDIFTAETDVNGIYELKLMELTPDQEGNATITASVDNFLPQTLVNKYTAGSITELNFKLKQIVPLPPVP